MHRHKVDPAAALVEGVVLDQTSMQALLERQLTMANFYAHAASPLHVRVTNHEISTAANHNGFVRNTVQAQVLDGHMRQFAQGERRRPACIEYCSSWQCRLVEKLATVTVEIHSGPEWGFGWCPIAECARLPAS